MQRKTFKKARRTGFAALVSFVLFQGQAMACAVCFSPEQNEKIRNAYLMATAVMLFMTIAVVSGLYLMIRHYRRESAKPNP